MSWTIWSPAFQVLDDIFLPAWKGPVFVNVTDVLVRQDPTDFLAVLDGCCQEVFVLPNLAGQCGF